MKTRCANTEYSKKVPLESDRQGWSLARMAALLPLIAGLYFTALPAYGCNVAAWTGGTMDVGLNLQPAAVAHFDADCGLRVHADGVNEAWVSDVTPGTLIPAATSYSARFYLLVNQLTLGANDEVVVFAGLDTADLPLFELLLVDDGGQKKLRLVSYNDNGVIQSTSGSEVTVIDGWRAIEMSWAAATAPGSPDGELKVKVDNVEAQQVIVGLDNDTHTLDEVRLGIVAGAASPSLTGSFNLDAFTSHRSGLAGLIYKTCSGNAVDVDNTTFLPGLSNCVGTTSFTTGPVVTVDSGANLTVTSPTIRLQSGFTASSGSVVHLVSP